MKNLLFKLAFIPFLLAVLFSSKIFISKLVATPPSPTKIVESPAQTTNSNKIQVAILLDVSGSMSGLIEQAKSQLWRVVNELSWARYGGEQPKLEIGLYSYGNGGTHRGIPFIQQHIALTSDLDRISEELFALRTSGSSEFCGQVIQLATDELEWSESPDDLKIIFIAGNEPFTQGPVPYDIACKAAKNKDIIVNAIYCGAANEGINSGWQQGALMANGQFMHIDHNQAIVQVASPFDDDIIELNNRLNDTYVTYGAHGYASQQNQYKQDQNAQQYSKANVASRALSKSNGLYSNSGWDLVDATKDNSVALDTVSREFLPAEIQDKSTEELKAFVTEKAQERKEIQAQILELNKKREAHVAAERAKQGEGNTLDQALIDALHKQAESKEIVFKKF